MKLSSLNECTMTISDKNILWQKKQDLLPTENIDIAAQTDIGSKRKTNQDRYAMACQPDDTVLMAIADGLGGEPGGETASDYVIEQVRKLTGNSCIDVSKDPVSFFKKMDEKLCALAEDTPELDGMATTLITIFIQNDVASWCHSGDSRLYHLRKDTLVQITRDQTFSRFLVQEGELRSEQAGHHFSHQVLDQFIGCRDLSPETGSIRLASGDMLILVTDGLYRSVSDADIRKAALRFKRPDQAALALVKKALEAGGKDNITVVIGKVC